MKKDFYLELDKILKTYENRQTYHYGKTMDWVSNRIVWLWRFKKIPKNQIDELADRATIIFESDDF